MSNKLQWTGERMVDNPYQIKGIIEHLHRYAICMDFVENKVVLDIACGEGYGCHLISQKAKKVIGVDISEAAVKHATLKYKSDNITFKLGSVLDIPLDNNSVDVIVSYETLEHLVEQEQMLTEFKRVLKNNGILFISTPEKENYAKIDPNNPYHLKELTYIQFKNLLGSYFSNTSIMHQKFACSSSIYNIGDRFDFFKEYSGSFNEITKSEDVGIYYFNIAICSNEGNPITLNSSLFNGNDLMHRSFNAIGDSIYSSRTFKIGLILTYPIRVIKNLFK